MNHEDKDAKEHKGYILRDASCLSALVVQELNFKQPLKTLPRSGYLSVE